MHHLKKQGLNLIKEKEERYYRINLSQIQIYNKIGIFKMREHFINLNFLIKYAILTKMEKYNIHTSLNDQIITKMNISIGSKEKKEYGMTSQKYMMMNAIHFIDKE